MNNEIILNEDNAISTLSRLSIKARKSEKTGSYFHIMTLHFKNGLSVDYFVDKKDLFGLKDAVSRMTNGEKVSSILNEDEVNM